jgi:hypothetical protein
LQQGPEIRARLISAFQKKGFETRLLEMAVRGKGFCLGSA